MNPPSPFVHTLEQWMHVVMHNSMLNLTRFAREHGYSMSQLMALNFINRKGPCGITGFGEEMGISSPAASQLLDRLVQHGMVLRTEDPSDRRSKLVALTDKGQGILEDSLRARHGWLSELETSLAPEEYDLAMQALDVLIERARQLEPSVIHDSNLHP